MSTLCPGSSLRARFLGLMLIPFLLAGCNIQTARFTQTTNTTAPHAAASGVKVTARNGSIAVRKATETSQVTIAATLRMVTAERLGEVSIVANRSSAGVLEISAKPPADGWRGGEGCSFDITVPEAHGVELESSNGRLTVVGLTGRAKLDTSNGAIEVADHDGDIEARSSNGRIEALGIAGAFRARTSNGAVVARLADRPSGPVEIGTSNGSVTLEITPAFRGELSISTSNGSIRLPESFPTGMSIQTRNTGRRATLTAGSDGPKSTIDTSNGGVTVRFAN